MYNSLKEKAKKKQCFYQILISNIKKCQIQHTDHSFPSYQNGADLLRWWSVDSQVFSVQNQNLQDPFQALAALRILDKLMIIMSEFCKESVWLHTEPNWIIYPKKIFKKVP